MVTPVMRSVWAICAASVWPSKGLPGRLRAEHDLSARRWAVGGGERDLHAELA
jgi:hypothetical protein